MIGRALIFAALTAMTLAGSSWLHAQPPVKGQLPAVKSSLQPATLADYANQIHRLQAVAAACAQKAAACQSPAHIASQKVRLGAGASFNARYEWFHAALASAKTRRDKARAAEMQAVGRRLSADLADAATPPVSAANFAVARQRANAILAEKEFVTADRQSLTEPIFAWLAMWMDRALMRMAAFGSHAPWIGPVIEYGLACLACVLLLLWVMRSARQQRLHLRLEAKRQIEVTDERVLNWMREAEQHAARGAFRDAVHCLYWASIVTLEGRRLWLPDRARTPREYLRLLDPASATAVLLRRQTLSFESIWYGLRPAQQSDYEQALTLHRQLRSA